MFRSIKLLLICIHKYKFLTALSYWVVIRSTMKTVTLLSTPPHATSVTEAIDLFLENCASNIQGANDIYFELFLNLSHLFSKHSEDQVKLIILSVTVLSKCGTKYSPTQTLEDEPISKLSVHYYNYFKKKFLLKNMKDYNL